MNHEVYTTIKSLIESESDWIAVLSTVTCELHWSHEHFHWTGFYRHSEPGILKVGPYQGGHGCLWIPFGKGVCGAAARSGKTQIVPDVHARPDHIACSSSTRSELVVPILNQEGQILGVLDIDSDERDAFSSSDIELVEQVCQLLGQHPAAPKPPNENQVT